MLWKYIPFGRYPMDLVKVKRGSKRLKKIVIVTPKQFKSIVGALPEPYYRNPESIRPFKT
jgi:hypothetical protein